MSLEQQISELNTTVKALVVALGSFVAAAGITAGATPEAAAPAPAADKKTKAADKKAEAAPTPSPAPAAVAEVKWADVLETIKAVSKSEKEGAGRDGVLKLMKQFGLNPETDKVPALEKLGKRAEIKAAAQALLDGTAQAGAGDDDLGI